MKWRCADGRLIEIADMATDHLKNAAAHLRRNRVVTPDEWWRGVAAAASCQGEMASYYADQEVTGMIPSRKLAAMEDELRRRT